jgi:CRISPR system Cascade subunit CasE
MTSRAGSLHRPLFFSKLLALGTTSTICHVLPVGRHLHGPWRAHRPVRFPAAHVTVRHQIQWLLKHQERAGFAVVRRSSPAPEDTKAAVTGGVPEEWAYELVVHDRAALRFGRPSGDGPKPASGADVRIAKATYDGCLRITDLAAFRRTLVQGLGKAKAYGCGLLTLAPARGADRS